ncbi:hypothetical protein ACLMJK_003605 [Lecanora helva]
MESSPSSYPHLIGLASNSEDSEEAEQKHTNAGTTNRKYFKSAQWSPDGTTILASTASNTLFTYILPPSLLSPPHPHPLTPYTTHRSPESIYATTFHPSYTLSTPSTCLLLASVASLPIRLISPFAPGILASYPLISPTTEAYTAPHSLLFNPVEPNYFFAGHDSCISLFDINRNGERPVSRMLTCRARRDTIFTPGAQNMKGLISAMAMSDDGVLAAGTFTRCVSLYDSHGSGDCIATFSPNNPNGAPKNNKEAQGAGVTQLLFSNPHYLIIAERSSTGISIYDTRNLTHRLAWLRGRSAQTPQRMSIDITTNSNGSSEIWAGGTDGCVRCWEGVGMREGVVEPSWGFQAHGDVVGSVGWHPGGGVLATCSGSRRDGMDGFEDESLSRSQIVDNNLKIWAF